MGPVRSRDSARSKPRGKLHPGMANGKGGPPLSSKDLNLKCFETDFKHDKQKDCITKFNCPTLTDSQTF